MSGCRVSARSQPSPRHPAPRLIYDAAQTTDENTRHWANADYLGPQAALDPSVRRTLRSRARYEIANDTYASGMIGTLANDTIGTGPTLQLLTRDKPAASQVEQQFWSWCQAVRLPMKLRTMRRSKAGDGEAFASFFANPRLRNSVRLDLQLHEAEGIASPTLGIENSGLTDGLILDDFGNVVAYTLLRDHPGERKWNGAGIDFEYVRAEDMLHLFNCDRPGQLRGCPEITPALPLYALRRRYALAVIRASENAALMTWILRTQQPPQTPSAEEPAAFDSIELERGMGMTLPEGWEMQQLKAEQPTAVYEQFTAAIIREIARCLHMPFNVAAGDSSSYNYASGRMDHQVYFKSIAVERSYFESMALEPILSKWWLEARLIPGYLPESLRGLREPPSHEWRWDGREHVDPVKEQYAITEGLRNGSLCLPDVIAKGGDDFEAVQEKQARALGMTVRELQERQAFYLYGAAAAGASAASVSDAEATDE